MKLEIKVLHNTWEDKFYLDICFIFAAQFQIYMFRTHTCGELRLTDKNKETTLAGWVQTVRKFGSITFVDLRDRYGITQLLFSETLTG